MTKARLPVLTLPLLCASLAACGGAQPPPPSTPAATPVTSAVPSAPAPSPTPPPITSATDLLSREHASFDPCYARARAARSDLGRTTVEITFRLDDAGKPQTVSLEYNKRWDEGAKECLRTTALGLSFPPALRGKQIGTIEFAPAK